MNEAITVGAITGSGTGRELVEVFKTAVSRIARKLGEDVQVIDCEHEFNSYHSLLESEPAEIEAAVESDLAKIKEFYEDFYATGGRIVFRTAFNAETLYRFRALGQALKTVHIPLPQKNVLFVRDQMQGFYAVDSCDIEPGQIRFSSSFSLDSFKTLAEYSLAEAQRTLRNGFDVWVVYKHHLFANVLEKWTNETLPGATVCQPNHATQLLYDYFVESDGRDLLLITGNEIGDILHEVLIFQLQLGTRNTMYSRNVYTHPKLAGLVEYQTVHGSADNIANRHIVNPLATLRAVGALVTEHLDRPEFLASMDDAISAVQDDGVMGYDGGGSASTFEITNSVLKRLNC